MYQIKFSSGYEIQVIGRGENGLCRVENADGITTHSGTYATCKAWLGARGEFETTAGANAADIATQHGR